MCRFFKKDIFYCINCECQQWLITLNKFKKKVYSKTPVTVAPQSQLRRCVLSSRLIFHSQSEWGRRWTNISAVIEDWLSLVCSTWNKGILPNELKPFITKQCRASIPAPSLPEELTHKIWLALSTRTFQIPLEQWNNDNKNHSSLEKKNPLKNTNSSTVCWILISMLLTHPYAKGRFKIKSTDICLLSRAQ